MDFSFSIDGKNEDSSLKRLVITIVAEFDTIIIPIKNIMIKFIFMGRKRVREYYQFTKEH